MEIPVLYFVSKRGETPLMRRSLSSMVLFLVVLAGPVDPQGPPPAAGQVRLRIDRDVEYARVGNRPLRLDLYLRDASTEPAPVVVWIHGGGWSAGDKFPTPAVRLVAAGYAVASVEYRLTGEAKFPAQIHDCKAAIRWLRANARKYNLDSAHIGVWGRAGPHHTKAGRTGPDLQNYIELQALESYRIHNGQECEPGSARATQDCQPPAATTQ
jgi:hypothetical protein